MMDKDIYGFAMKWFNKFKNNYNFYDIFDNLDFPNECKRLNFEMDCDNSFINKYGSDATTYEGLKNKIDNIDNIKILGSGIFSQWRYFNHWADAQPEEDDIKWFILCLNRLKELVNKQRT